MDRITSICPPFHRKFPQIFTGLPGIRMVASLQNGSMAWSGEEATLGKWRRDVRRPSGPGMSGAGVVGVNLEEC